MHTVLLISKDRSVTQMLETLLAQHSFIIRTEGSFNDAMDELKRAGHYDMLVSLEKESNRRAADIQRTISKISPYARFVHLAGTAAAEDPNDSTASGNGTPGESCDLMDILEEILRISMELKSNPNVPAMDEMKGSLYNSVHLMTSILHHQGIIHGTQSQEAMTFSMELGKRLGFPQQMLDQLAFSTLLKDVGMLKVDPKIKDRPRGLTDEEFAELKKHCVHGVNIITKIKLPWDIKDNILCHHERYDGSGYPLGLHGHEIPVGARIIAAVDAFLSMTSPRPYRGALEPREAFAEFEKNLGRQFDPDIGKEFLNLVELDSKSDTARPSKLMRVAVIDDDSAARNETMKALQRIGYQPLALEEGHSALEYLRLNKVNLILSDVGMPGVDGYQLLHWVKQLPELESIPFILMSASQRDSSNVVMALEMGADDYFLKPLDDANLESRIQAAMAKKESPPAPRFSSDEIQDEETMQIVRELLRLKEESASGELSFLEPTTYKVGKIFFVGGHIRHAEYKDLKGEEAFYEILSIPNSETRFAGSIAPMEVTITSGLEYLLIEALRRVDNSPETSELEFQLA